jgi:L-threonylcarbamoyladenylate synthase
MRIVAPDAAGLAIAAAAIECGEVVAYPTETVYGLAVDPFSDAALERLFAIKQRDLGKPVLLIVADETQLTQVVREVSPVAAHFMGAFWPGPLSLLFPRHPNLPEAVTAGGDKVCVRCPGSDVARALCAASGHAITSTSANPSGNDPALSVETLALSGIAVAIDGGPCNSRIASTVYDPDTDAILREGVISAEALRIARARFIG